MEEQWYADRAHLRCLMNQHPNWTRRQFIEATGRSESWVKKWLKRLREADPDDETILHGLSRARHNPPKPVDPAVVERILEIREDPPDNLERIPGPKTILYYLHKEDEPLKASGVRLPTSTSTIWKILDQHGCIYRPPVREHEPLERPDPMTVWQFDFKDVSSVPADPDGKQQHVVECFNVVDAGTSVLLDALVRDDFRSDRAIWAITNTLQQYGVPKAVVFDRDPRFVGSWSGRDFPAPLVRFLMCLGIRVRICPPQRPDKNAYVERYHRNYNQECLQIHHPSTLGHAQEVTATFMRHYNFERPNQATACNNQPPRLAFPTLPKLPPLPRQIDPDGWLKAIDGRVYRRRVGHHGSIKLDNRYYYVKKALRGQYVNVKIDAKKRELIIEHRKRPIKHVPIKGLYHEILDFADYFELILKEAQVHWRRVQRQLRRSR
jgi:hypothetical protein